MHFRCRVSTPQSSTFVALVQWAPPIDVHALVGAHAVVGPRESIGADERLPHGTSDELWPLAAIRIHDLHVEDGREPSHAPASERPALELVLDDENAVLRRVWRAVDAERSQ